MTESNKDQLPKSALRTLESIEPKSFHTLPYKDQLVVVNNTTIDIDQTTALFEPLSLSRIDEEELAAIQLLVSSNDLVGPFSATFFEGQSAWSKYLYYTSPQITQAFQLTAERELWWKYMALSDYDPHRLGEVVHAINLILEGMMPSTDLPRSLSPGKTIPAYRDAVHLVGEEKVGKSLFVGAFSVKSVEGIWGISKYLTPEEDSMEIIDVDGALSAKAAKHYGIPFSYVDGMETNFQAASYDSVFTNNLTPALPAYTYIGPYEARTKFLREMRRIIRPSGSLIMVEPPFFDVENEDEITEELRKLDIDSVRKEMLKIGFNRVEVTPLKMFSLQNDVDEFLQTGNFDESKVVVENAIQSPSLIVGF